MVKIQDKKRNPSLTNFFQEKQNEKINSKINDLRGKKILFGFNMANDFAATTRLFHKNGLYADIVAQKSDSIISFNTANPLQEYPDFPKKHFYTWDSRLSSSPFPLTKILINTYELFRSFFFNHLNYMYLGRQARSYDMVISTNQNRYFYGHKHPIIYDAGPIRLFMRSRRFPIRMDIKAYKKAELVIFTNPDTLPLFHSLGIKNLQFMPLPGDYKKYIPKPKQDNDIFTIFSPTRQNWRAKVSHHLIHAFASASKNVRMQLVITEWGVDINRTKALVKKLKIEQKVKYIPFGNKNQIIEKINNADIIADQFGCGSYGSASIEAMACAKPVLVYVNVATNKLCFGEMPPVLNCQSIRSIERRILELYTNRKKGKSIGKKAQKWIREKHNPQTIFEQYINIIHNSLIK